MQLLLQLLHGIRSSDGVEAHVVQRALLRGRRLQIELTLSIFRQATIYNGHTTKKICFTLCSRIVDDLF